MKGAVSAHNSCMRAREGVRRAWERGKGAYRAFTAHRTTTIAGTLVFFLIMSLVPFLFWLTLLFGGTEMFERLFELQLFGWARDFLLFLNDNARGATAGAGIVLLATTFWSSSAFFYHLRRIGEIVYGARRVGSGWKIRVAALLLTVGVLLLVACCGGMLVAVMVLGRGLPQWLGSLLLYAALLACGFLAAWVLNLYVCPVRGCAKQLLPGSFFTAVAWLVASAVFALYLSFSNKEKLYGALTLVIVFLLWLYWLMICFVAGVVFNKRRVADRAAAQNVVPI